MNITKQFQNEINQQLKNLMFGSLTGVNNTFRFSGKSLIKNQSVAEHSYWVAIIAGELAKIENLLRKFEFDKEYDNTSNEGTYVDAFNLSKVYQYALFHDMDEVFTGDLNHRFKYFDDSAENTNFRMHLKLMVDKVVQHNLKCYPKDILKYYELNKQSSGIEEIVKLADWFQLMQYVQNEMNLGSSCLDDVYDRIILLLAQKIHKSDLLISKPLLWEFLLEEILNVDERKKVLFDKNQHIKLYTKENSDEKTKQ